MTCSSENWSEREENSMKKLQQDRKEKKKHSEQNKEVYR
jgi:hypothetical protein